MTKKNITVLCVCAVVIAGTLLWWCCGRSPRGVSRSPVHHAKSTDPLTPAVDAYNKGNYREAEAEAQKIINANAGSKDPKKRRESVEARYLLAFCSARRKDMPQARDRFTILQHEAAKLSDKGARAPLPGVVRPTLEQDGAYQHAVCTAAIGDKKSAEAEFMAFIRSYPESPLTSAAVQRIERLHGGQTVPAAEAAWQKASRIAREREDARRKAEENAMSACGPECLAELLHRYGRAATVESLSKELGTTTQGTSMFAMVQVAKKRGLPATGVSLTQKGLQKQPLPLLTLVQPGHYVIVDKLTRDTICIWDPFAQGPGKPGTKTYKLSDWQFQWTGAALVITDKQ